MCRLTNYKVNAFISNTAEIPTVYENSSADSEVLAKEITKNFKEAYSHPVFFNRLSNFEHFLHILFQQKTNNSRCITSKTEQQKKFIYIFWFSFVFELLPIQRLNDMVFDPLITFILLLSSNQISRSSGLRTFKVPYNKVGQLL